MAKYEKDPRQIIRLDGKNCFLEVMNSAFAIGKVQINFREYDEKQQKGNRFTKEIDLFMDMDKFLVFANDIISGKVAKMAEAEKARAKQESDKQGKTVYPRELDEFTDMGGMNPESLKRSDERRKKNEFKPYSEMYAIPQGKCLSRQLKVVPGLKAPFMLKGEVGVGEESDTGLIVPKYGTKPSQMVQVPIPANDLKKLALTVQSHINGYITAQYMVNATTPQAPNNNNNK
jgi:hypothetical protein